jgi:predicted ATPase/serine phosphatase RsbU (regulator of sigma subunit)
MLQIPKYSFTRKLHEAQDVEVFRGFRDADGSAVVAKVLRGDHPSVFALARLRHEHHLLAGLDLPGVVKAYALEPVGNSLALVMSDAGDASLDKAIRSAELPLARSLRIAITLARVIAEMHDKGVLHKDLKPQHLFVTEDEWPKLTLIDFGIATRLNQERQAVLPPAELEGTLAYISPEQTGRMNRVVDQRSDLYSLGVTLYELFTQRLPFPSSDPLEVLHCHLAKSAEPPHSVRGDLPVVLSQVVMKLLSKLAEERYQTAWGLEHDLSQILDRVVASGTAHEFELGQRDGSGELRIPQRLYGRQSELEKLRASFERARSGASEILFVGGHSGIGKTALVHELQHSLVGTGYLATGKFDRLNRSLPYSAIAEAGARMIEAILAESQEVLELTKDRLIAALGRNGRVMTELIPSLELVIGPQPELLALGPLEAQNRLELVFQNFIGAFTHEGRTLVLHLDDLQWADAASLALLQGAISAPESKNLLVVASYRDNEVDAAHPLAMMREDLRKEGISSEELRVGSLTLAAVMEFLCDALGATRDGVGDLAESLLAKTQGNPFFLSQFLLTLAKDGILVFTRSRSRWEWDLERVNAALATDNVVDFMLTKLRQLPNEAREVLKLAACIGHEFDTKTLALIANGGASKISTALWPALSEGLIIPKDAKYRYADTDDAFGEALNPKYLFLHDRVQEAAYEQLDQSLRLESHLAIGRMLLQNDQGNERIFEVTDHLNRAAALITDPDERRKLAQLNVEAGRRARASAALNTAARYFGRAIGLLGEEGWKRAYEATLSAHLLVAECAQVTAEVEEGLRGLDATEAHAKTLLDRVGARNIRTELLTRATRLHEAVAVSVETMRMLGDTVPSLDDPAALGGAIGEAFGAYQAARGARPVASLAELQPMTDPVKLALIETYAKVIPAAFLTVKEVMVLGVLKAAMLSLQDGTAPITPFMYAQYGLVHALVTGDHDTAYQYGRLGVNMAERAGNPALLVRPSVVFGGFLSHWKKPLDEGLQQLRTGLRLALDTGDAVYSTYAANFIAIHLFFSGAELNELSSTLTEYITRVDRNKDRLNRGVLVVLRQAAFALTGRTESFDSLNSADFSESEFEQTQPPPALGVWGPTKAWLRLLGGHWKEALDATDAFPALPKSLYSAESTFLRAVALARFAGATPADQRGALVEELRGSLEVLATWASDCPENHAHRHKLVEAELAALEGNVLQAADAYEDAVALSRRHGLVHHQALASELCARFHLTHGRPRLARPYLLEALYAYRRWGATAKVLALVADHKALIDVDSGETKSRGTAPTLVGGGSTTGHSAGHLDLTTAMRTTEAIASELDLERVVERIMHHLVENAGAQRGFLALCRNGKSIVSAAVTVDPHRVRLDIDEDIDATNELSAAIVRYVERSKAALILEDASSDHRFAADPYVSRRKPKSVLCIPLLHRATLVGAFYLENNGVTGGFSPGRVELLQFLAVQAAAALENARLYGDLNQATRQLKASNETLEAQVAERTQALKRAVADLWSEMDVAKKIQTVLLPPNLQREGLQIAALMQPADSVGGDYYDIIESGDRTWVIVGDASGHGVPAGLVMMMIQTAIRTLVTTAAPGSDLSPATVLTRANHAVASNLQKMAKGQYMTVTALEFDGGRVRFAGLHQDLLVYRAASKTVERIETHGVWIGVLDALDGLLEDEVLELQPGDTLLLFSDGVTELRLDGEMLGTERLAHRFKELALRFDQPNAIVQGLIGTLVKETPNDDVTLLAVRYDPTQVRRERHE